jgi:uncharacterized protein
MKVKEHALCFACGSDTLVGVLAQPEPGPGEAVAAVAVLVIVGGPQVRVGSHRQFLQLSRELATAGVPVLRFDVRGMGDSSGQVRTFEELDDDIAAAADALLARQTPGTRLVLWGLCDGASAALLYLDRRRDARVAGLALANPWLRSAQSLAQTQVKHYYRRRLMQPAFWAQLLRGGVPPRSVGQWMWALWHSRRVGTSSSHSETLDFRQRMARAWQGFGGPLLLLLSEADLTAREFEGGATAEPAWAGALARANVQLTRLHGADHTFSNPEAKATAHATTQRWLQQNFGANHLQAPTAAVASSRA